MNATALPIDETVRPGDRDEVVAVIKQAHAQQSPLYVVGGGTSQDHGLPATSPGTAIQLTELNRVIDYPARDMTITLESGVTMSELTRVLKEEGQELPLDASQAGAATIGGVIAANWNGPRRFGLGAVRDHVIGIEAVDGRGVVFHGGGRVVKNVAGYDFCKLLTGSYGTLGVITQVTLKLKPLPATRQTVVLALPDIAAVNAVLDAQVNSPVNPVALEWLTGAGWPLGESLGRDTPHGLVAIVEGTEAETAWSVDTLHETWRDASGREPRTLDPPQAAQLWEMLVEFAGQPAPVLLKAAVRPSGVGAVIEAVRNVDPAAAIQAHAGNGVVLIACSEAPEQGLLSLLSKTLRPVASRYDGSVVVLMQAEAAELTRQTVWGHIPAEPLMRKLKLKFDPAGVLNPGRFIYAHL